MRILLYLFMVLAGIIGLVVVISLLASLAAIVYTLLPIARVPFRYNFRNLQVRWKTTLVTALAFTLVIGLLTIMLAFVKGMNRLTQESGQPGNIMILSSGATDESFSNLSGGVGVQLLPKNVQDMVKREGDKYWAVKEVYVIVNHELASESGERKRRLVQMRGVDDAVMAAKIHNIQLPEGQRWFGRARYEVVLGNGIAKVFGKDLGKEAAEPGDEISIGKSTWKVVGVMKPSSSTYGSEVWSSDVQVQQFGRENSYSTYVVRVKNPRLAEKAADFITNYRSQEPFSAMTEQGYFDKLSQTNQQFLFAAIFVAIIMAVGGVLGVMNTMFAAISQRAKDIGVLRLLGYSRLKILMSFLFESIAIAFLGGLLGCALGYLFDGFTVTSIVSSGQGGGGKSVVLKLMVDGSVLGAGMFLTLVMGSVGGLAPALSAMRLRPLESLR